jgi:Ca2+-binding EF-hand superfamily protein
MARHGSHREKSRNRLLPPLLGAAAVLATSLSAISPSGAFTDKEITAIFRMLDTNGDGKVTREEYSTNKVMILYRNAPKGNTTLTFEQTKVSRAFFDAADADHDGTLSPVEAMDALRFEAVDTDSKGYITLDDLRRFMTRVGR